MELKDKAKNLPSCPGVYLMKDSQGGIIYVGKAKDLKRRVQSYFKNAKTHSPKIAKLVKHLRDFEYLLTDTEFEAFMLECKLIQQLKPIYNKKMKSPLSYKYIVIQLTAGFPGISITNRPNEADHNYYFGPYTNQHTVERALQGIKESLKIMCSNPTIKGSTCLNYSLGRCIGMCQGGSTTEEYKQILYKIVALLNGTDLRLPKELEQKMLNASKHYDFETAAKYRDYLNAINYLLNKKQVIKFTGENKNILIIEEIRDCQVKLFLVKRNQILFSEKYLINSDLNQLCTLIKTNILTYFNPEATRSSGEIRSYELDEAQIIYSYLKGSACRYMIIPEKWLELGDVNLDEAIYKLLRIRTASS